MQVHKALPTAVKQHGLLLRDVRNTMSLQTVRVNKVCHHSLQPGQQQQPSSACKGPAHRLLAHNLQPMHATRADERGGLSRPPFQTAMASSCLP